MTTWSRLFYCQRCDHVYDPQNQTYRPVYDMRQLLGGAPPPMRALSNPGAQPYAAPLLIGAAIWVATIGASHAFARGQSADAAARSQRALAAKSPQVKQFNALLPEINGILARGSEAVNAERAGSSQTVPDYDRDLTTTELAAALNTLTAQRDSVRKDLADFVQDASVDDDAFNNTVQQTNADLNSLDKTLRNVKQEVGSVGNNASPGLTVPAAPGLTITTRAGGGKPPHFDPITGTVAQ